MLTGTIVEGKYKLLDELGTGGYASVYRAINIATAASVAIKKISSTPKTTPMIFQEVNISLKPELKSPNIAETIEAIIGVGCVYMVMKLYEDGDVRKLINICQFHHIQISENKVKAYGFQIFSGLDVLQRNGIIHRDLKPENLLFKEDGTICIIDFGIAKTFEIGGGVQSQSTLKGTLGYASPEQIKQEINLTPACDIFSVGIILYELITGHVPFSGHSLMNFPKAVKNKAYTSISTLVSQDLADLIQRMLSYDPKERPTAKELLSHPCFKISQIENGNDNVSLLKKENEELKLQVEKQKRKKEEERQAFQQKYQDLEKKFAELQSQNEGLLQNQKIQSVVEKETNHAPITIACSIHPTDPSAFTVSGMNVHTTEEIWGYRSCILEKQISEGVYLLFYKLTSVTLGNIEVAFGAVGVSPLDYPDTYIGRERNSASLWLDDAISIAGPGKNLHLNPKTKWQVGDEVGVEIDMASPVRTMTFKRNGKNYTGAHVVGLPASGVYFGFTSAHTGDSFTLVSFQRLSTLTSPALPSSCGKAFQWEN